MCFWALACVCLGVVLSWSFAGNACLCVRIPYGGRNTGYAATADVDERSSGGTFAGESGIVEDVCVRTANEACASSALVSTLRN